MDSCKTVKKEIKALKTNYTNPSKAKPEIVGDLESIKIIKDIFRIINEKILQA